MDAQTAWGAPSVSYPSLPPPPPGSAGHGYAASSTYMSSSPANPGFVSAYPPLPSGPPPVIPSFPHSVSPSAPWMSSSPSAAASAPDDFADSEVVPYSGGGAEPYGARGTGSGAYWGDATAAGHSAGTGMVKVEIPQLSAGGGSGGTRGGSSSAHGGCFTEGVLSTVEDGVHSFRVKLLAEDSSSSSSSAKDVVCKIGLDGVRITEAGTGRLMRIYPLDIITRWEVKEPTVFTFWVRTAVDVDQRAVRLKSNAATTTLILDTLTAACIQVFEMVGKDSAGAKSEDPSQEAGKKTDAGAAAAGGAAAGSSFVDWMLARSKSTVQAPAPTVEKHHWVPDEEVTKCSSCYTDFGTFVRRHHCRNCGNVFCDKCTKGRTPLTSEAGAPSVRVCDACLAEVTRRLSFQKEAGVDSVAAPPNTSSSAGTGSSIPSHEELMKRLTDELKKSGSISTEAGKGSSRDSERHAERNWSGRNTSTPPFSAIPPALTGQPPSSVHPAAGKTGAFGSPAPGASASAGAAAGEAWLSTCAFCSTVALVSSSDPRCPSCGTSSAAPAPASQQPPSATQRLPQVPPPYGHPVQSGGSSLQGPPHLWPHSTAPGPVAPPGPKREVVACPTCTAHLEVQVPAVGTETLQCGVCQHPFLVGTA